MPTFLLDTSTISFALRNPRGSISAQIQRTPDNELAVSSIVVAELESGYARKRAHRALSTVREFLDALILLPFGRDEAVSYGIVRDELERSGHPIGDRNTMIAATALARGCVVVTDNVRHFSRVDGLQVENWHAGR